MPCKRFSLVLNNDHTLDTVADWLWTNMFFSSATHEERILRSIEISLYDLNGDLSLPIALLNLDDVYVHMRVKSSLALQNRTLGATATDNSKDDVTNNPLEGKSFGGSGNGTKMHVQDNTALLGSNTFYGDLKKGLIEFDPAGTTVTAGMQSVLRRPPTANAFVGAMSVGHVRLGPGHIKKSIWVWKRKMRLSAYLNAMQERLRFPATTAFPKVPLAKFEFFGFEKLCRTGSGSEPVSVGYELNQSIGAYCSLKRRGIPCDQLVLTGT